MKTSKFFTLLAAVPFLFASCLSTDDDDNNKEQDVLETNVNFEDATLGSDGLMVGSYATKETNSLVFDNHVEEIDETTKISYGFTATNLFNKNTDGETNPYSVFANMTTYQGTKFAAYIPNDMAPSYIHRKDGTLFKPFYMDVAISTRTLHAVMNGYGDETAFGEKDSITVTIRGIDTMGLGSTNKLTFNLVNKSGLLMFNSATGLYGYLAFNYLSSYSNLWIPLYLSDLGSVTKLLIEMKSTKKNTPLGLAIDNFVTYTTVSPGKKKS